MLNLAFGWIWISMGFVAGAVLGMGFHKDEFMGGYNSWARRLTRLGHIAFFGTGFLNLLAAFSGFMLRDEITAQRLWTAMSWSFVIGALAMPICCFIAARWKSAKSIFVIPVLSLTLGGVLISWITTQALIGGVL